MGGLVTFTCPNIHGKWSCTLLHVYRSLYDSGEELAAITRHGVQSHTVPGLSSGHWGTLDDLWVDGVCPAPNAARVPSWAAVSACNPACCLDAFISVESRMGARPPPL